MIIFFSQIGCARALAWRNMGNCSVVKPARDFVLFVFSFLFCKVPYTTTWKGCFHIKYKKKMKNATNILFSLTTLPEKNEIKKILPFDCSIYSQINFRNKTKKNLPPFYELMNYDTSNDMIFPLSCWQKIMKKYKQKP